MKAWLITYAIIWAVEFYLFGMQRATLLISRKSGVEWRGGGELLLPKWYPASWAIIVGKWVLLALIALRGHWKMALALAAVGYLASIALPIPYQIYKKTFRRRIKQLESREPIRATQLRQLLDNAPF